MTTSPSNAPAHNTLADLRRHILLGGAAVVGFVSMDALRYYQEVHMIRAVLGLIIVASIMKILGALLQFSANELAWRGANRASGLKGSATWATWAAIKGIISPRGGIFLGACHHGGKRRPVMVDFQSNALCIAPAGTGKGIYTVVPSCLAIRASKLVIDFKGELACLLKPALEARGERVLTLNFSDLFTEIIGKSECFNPLGLIADLFWRAGGLTDMSDDCDELCKQLCPEPDKGGDENAYFREGSRKILTFAILFCILKDGDEATLGDVALLLNDREQLFSVLQLVCGELVMEGEGAPESRKAPPFAIEDAPWAQTQTGAHNPSEVINFIAWFRALASGLHDMMAGGGRTFESFLSGAAQAVDSFNITTRVQKLTASSTFSFDLLKDRQQVSTIFIIIDASRLAAQRQALGLMQWCAATAIKRHRDKDVPVYLISDEATNFKLNELQSLLTWGRGYGLRHFLIFQDMFAFIKAYSQDCFQTLMSETEIKQFLPGQRSQKTLELISKLLGEQSVMAAGYSGAQKEFHDLGGHDLREEARPMMTPDEIRRCGWAINIVRRLPAFLTEPVHYGEIAPWRKQVGINPFHGQRFLRKVKLRLRRFPKWRVW